MRNLCKFSLGNFHFCTSRRYRYVIWKSKDLSLLYYYYYLHFINAHIALLLGIKNWCNFFVLNRSQENVSQCKSLYHGNGNATNDESSSVYIWSLQQHYYWETHNKNVFKNVFWLIASCLCLQSRSPTVLLLSVSTAWKEISRSWTNRQTRFVSITLEHISLQIHSRPPDCRPLIQSYNRNFK